MTDFKPKAASQLRFAKLYADGRLSVNSAGEPLLLNKDEEADGVKGVVCEIRAVQWLTAGELAERPARAPAGQTFINRFGVPYPPLDEHMIETGQLRIKDGVLQQRHRHATEVGVWWIDVPTVPSSALDVMFR